MPSMQAARAARACTKSVSANVRTRRGGLAAEISTLAPARAIEPASSRAAARQPPVLSPDTTRMSTPLIGGLCPRTHSPDSPRRAVQLEQVRAKARRAHEPDRLERRGALDIEA